MIPENDIYFIKGPMDVLDHSSSKFAYGSKMGIDATIKLEEELNGDVIKFTPLDKLVTNRLKEKYDKYLFYK